MCVCVCVLGQVNGVHSRLLSPLIGVGILSQLSVDLLVTGGNTWYTFMREHAV